MSSKFKNPINSDFSQELQEQQFAEIVNIIIRHRSLASQSVNEESLMSAWHVGAFISSKLKSEEWGSKVVTQLSEYIRSQYPDLKGYSRRNIYNMVMFFEEYSSQAFSSAVTNYLSSEFVQPRTAQLSHTNEKMLNTPSIYSDKDKIDNLVYRRSFPLPKVLTMTTLTNHIEILCRCKSPEERLFYILYSHKERLKKRELQRCIDTNTYSTLLSNKTNLSKGLLDQYPNAPVIFKDTLFVDFLGLPQKHSENKLKNGLIEHMKQFILELGKDFIFMDQEYTLNVGSSTYKADLLFFHRGLQALVAVELKKTKFHPRDLGQLEFYLEALDRDVKRSNENPSIGIILCPDSDHVVVEYAMSRSMSPTMVAEYKRILIPQERMQEQLNEFCQFFIKDGQEKSF